MSLLAVFRNDDYQAGPTESVEELLVAMCRYGSPSVSRLSKGWWVRCDMHVAAEGTTFKIESDVLPDLRTAAQQCMDRIIKTVNQYKDAA